MKGKGIRNGLTALVLTLAMLLCAWAAAEEIPENAQDLVLDQEMTASVGENEPAYFRFVPEETAVYDFRSYSGDDTYGYLYQVVGGTLQQLDSNDDENDETCDFCISRILAEGETYYFAARYWDTEQSGSFSVMLTRNTETGLKASAVGQSEIQVKPDESATLRVAAIGGEGDLTYVWMKDGEEITGQTTNAYTIEGVSAATQIDCIISDQNESATVTFYVDIDNGFSAEADGPDTLAAEPDTPITLTVKAECYKGGVTYEWYAEGYDEETGEDYVRIEGAEGPSYTVQAVTTRTDYYCHVRDEYGHFMSVRFRLSVENGFSAEPDGEATVRADPGDSVTFKVNAVCKNGAITYEWQKHVYTSEGDDALETIRGATGASYTVEDAKASQNYYCNVSDEYGNYKTIDFYLNLDNGFYAEGEDESPAAVPGESVTLKVNAECNIGGLSYRWYDSDDDEIVGETEPSYTTPAINGITTYSCRVSDDYGNSARIYFDISLENGFTAAADGPDSLKVKPDETVSVTWKVKAEANDGEISYQWYKDDEEIEGATGTSYTDTVEGNTLIGRSLEYYCEVRDQYGNCETIWFEAQLDNGFTAVADGPIQLTVKPGETVTLKVFAQVYTGNVYYRWHKVLTDGGYKTEQIAGATEASYTTGEISRYSEYMCVVGDGYGHYKDIWFDIYIDNGFSMKAESPDEIMVNPGESATMKVSAKANEGEISYQWYKREYEAGSVYFTDNPITGETSTSLTVENVQSYTEYSCRANDVFGNLEVVNFKVGIDNDFYAKADGPLYVTVEPGEPLSLKVIAKANAGDITYQWYVQHMTEQGFYDMKKLEGAAEAAYTEAKVDRHGLYLCDVRDSYGTMTRVTYWVYVDNGLTAEADGPDHVTAGAGDPVTLKVRASAKEGDITYEWYERKYEEAGDNYSYKTSYISGETGTSLTTEATGFRREIVCRVKDHYDNSTEVLFVIDAENTLTAGPEGSSVITVNPGKTATLKVRAETGTGEILYNWYKMNYIRGAYTLTKVSGTENRNSYTTEALYQNSQYQCHVRDQFGNEENIIFMVNVGSVPALQMYMPAQAEITAGGTYAMFSFEPPASGTYRIESTGGEDTFVTLFDGSGHGKWPSMAKDDDGGEELNFGLEYELEAGHRYYYGISFYSGEKTGTISFLLTGSFPTVEESFALPKGMTAEIPVPEDFGQPVSASVSDGTVAAVSGKTVTAKAVGDTAVTVLFENGVAVCNFTVLSADGTLKLPEGLETLMEDAFSGDENIRIAELGSAVKTVAGNALAAPNLAVAVIRGKTTQLDPDAFGKAKPVIVCPAGSEAETWARQHECKLLYLP